MCGVRAWSRKCARKGQDGGLKRGVGGVRSEERAKVRGGEKRGGDGETEIDVKRWSAQKAGGGPVAQAVV